MTPPITHVIDSLKADQERRLARDYAWLFEAGEKLRRERMEQHRETGEPNKQPVSNR